MKQTGSRMSHLADWEAEVESKVTELPQGERISQGSCWAMNSLSTAEALKSMGKRLLPFYFEDYCSVTRKKKSHFKADIFFFFLI